MFDPIQEDCLRLVLESMRREHISPLENPLYIQRSMDAFRADPASLIHTDHDRSFHLVAKATEIIDYQIPFMPDDAQIDTLADRAESYLREAVELDSGNWDAKRMLAAMDAETNDAYVGYLLDHRADVEADLAAIRDAADDLYSREFAADLAARPWLRWLAALASRALIAGQYRLSLRAAEESLAACPQDPADIRHTGMLALAKLEASAEELRRFRVQHAAAYQAALPQRRRQHPPERDLDAWTLLAEMSAAYRALDYTGADRTLRLLLRAYPHAAQALFYQAEFPDGVYSRVSVTPGSEDELIIAISEATPLLQEGIGTPDNAGFSTWLAEHELVQSGLDGQTARAQAPSGTRRAGGEN